MSKMTPINCCCDARKTLGFVPLDQDSLTPGKMVTFCAMNTDNDDQLTLPVGRVKCSAPGQEIEDADLIAIKSMDTPMEALKQIPGFEEFISPHEVGTDEYRKQQAEKYVEHGLRLRVEPRRLLVLDDLKAL